MDARQISKIRSERGNTVDEMCNKMQEEWTSPSDINLVKAKRWWWRETR